VRVGEWQLKLPLFDRMLIAQAAADGITLLTADRAILRYSGPIRSAL
jgi:PIN domain nuclease of toxin-antitoxin system